jgi:hypothetical protein
MNTGGAYAAQGPKVEAGGAAVDDLRLSKRRQPWRVTSKAEELSGPATTFRFRLPAQEVDHIPPKYQRRFLVADCRQASADPSTYGSLANAN